MLVGVGMGAALAGARFGFTTGWRQLIEQKDPAAAIFETAGRATDNRLSRSLDQEQGRGWKRAEPGKTRLYGRAVYKARKSIEREMEQVVLKAVNTVQRELG